MRFFVKVLPLAALIAACGGGPSEPGKPGPTPTPTPMACNLQTVPPIWSDSRIRFEMVPACSSYKAGTKVTVKVTRDMVALPGQPTVGLDWFMIRTDGQAGFISVLDERGEFVSVSLDSSGGGSKEIQLSPPELSKHRDNIWWLGGSVGRGDNLVMSNTLGFEIVP